MINLAIFFGGKSFEHDISIITGVQCLSHANLPNYNIVPIYVREDGKWFVGDELYDLDNYSSGLNGVKEVTLSASSKTLYYIKKSGLKKYKDIDVAILCFHGGLGEGGGISALLTLADIPYSSCDMTASAVCLDKGLFKYIAKGLGVPHIDGVGIFENEYLLNRDGLKDRLNDIGYPLILKPSRLGSSIGIEVVKNEGELDDKVLKAFSFDKKVLVEQYVEVEKEINIAIVKNKGQIIFSNTEEPLSSSEILSFDEKYKNGSSGFESIKRIMPAKISKEMEERIKEISSLLYNKLDLYGVVRFDFILDKGGNLYINEINTIPGSMANYLFDKSKLPYERLVDILVSNAISRMVGDQKKQCTYSSDILKSGSRILEK